VILLRRGGKHSDRVLELLLLRRGEGARFMPGVWVFAGGVVDAADREAATSPPDGVDADDWAHRVCGARELGEEAGVEIDPEALVPWSRWITPEVVPARFDTRFYVALAPPHTTPKPDEVEMDEARWFEPAAALEAAASDEIELSFPTVKHLEELKDFTGSDEVLAAADGREIPAILPKVVASEDSFDVLLPDEPGYDEA
jgi:8-oxo-dGTP pyrophosphatase MutT (NUDIX family)